MRREPIQDPDGDRVLAQEQEDRALEHADSPRIHLGPIDFCRDCGCPSREVAPSQWACPCTDWSVAA